MSTLGWIILGIVVFIILLIMFPGLASWIGEVLSDIDFTDNND